MNIFCGQRSAVQRSAVQRSAVQLNNIGGRSSKIFAFLLRKLNLTCKIILTNALSIHEITGAQSVCGM